jgi:hypothetical protein
MAWAAASAELLAPDNDRKQNDRWEWVACNDGAELSLLSPMIAPNVSQMNGASRISTTIVLSA